MKSLIFALFFFFNARAEVPTMEGLFKNNNNEEVKENVAMVQVVAKVFDRSQSPQEAESERRFYKLYFSNKDKRKIKFLQVEYGHESMKDEQVIGLKYFEDFGAKAEKDNNVLRALLHANLLNFSLNTDTVLLSLLRDTDSGFKFNREIVNREKESLLYRHEKYLKALKANPTSAKRESSPMFPSEAKDKRVAEAVRNSSYYIDTGAVKLTKVDKSFFWELKLENIDALFEAQTRRIVKLETRGRKGGASLSMAGYMLYDGVHELPKQIGLSNNSNFFGQVEIRQ